MNVCIRGFNCCQTGGYRGIELSKCVYLASMGVKIEHTVGVQNKDFFFSKCIPDGHVYRNSGHNQSKNCENLCLRLRFHVCDRPR